MSSVSRNPASYLFVAATAAGRRTLGVRQAATPRALAEALRKDRLLLLRSYPLPSWLHSQKQGLSLKDRVELNEQLSQLLSRGVPLVETLEVTAATIGGTSAQLVSRMREMVAAGSSFADACQKVGAFDPVTVSVYRAAERTGDLAGSAQQLAVTARRQLSISGKAATLLIYPIIVLSISVIVATVMLTVVVPMIAGSFRQMRVDLPWYSEVVMSAGVWLRAHGLWVLGALGVLLVAGVIARKQVVGAVTSLARRIPLMREVVLAQEAARFFSVMAAMTRSGIPLADALGVANQAVGLPVLRRQLETLRTKLIEGGILRALIEAVDALPLATRRLLIAAERAGDLETAFDGLAADMANETETRSARLLAALQPLLIVVMFLIIGSIMLSIMVPLITLTSKAKF
ncbi:MAG: type II secretion system F family protein [Phycisphaerae bacterium]|nr:type II secretion system F family protein [Phycisphaerae bacterium]